MAEFSGFRYFGKFFAYHNVEKIKTNYNEQRRNNQGGNGAEASG